MVVFDCLRLQDQEKFNFENPSCLFIRMQMPFWISLSRKMITDLPQPLETRQLVLLTSQRKGSLPILLVMEHL